MQIKYNYHVHALRIHVYMYVGNKYIHNLGNGKKAAPLHRSSQHNTHKYIYKINYIYHYEYRYNYIRQVSLFCKYLKTTNSFFISNNILQQNRPILFNP